MRACVRRYTFTYTLSPCNRVVSLNGVLKVVLEVAFDDFSEKLFTWEVHDDDSIVELVVEDHLVEFIREGRRPHVPAEGVQLIDVDLYTADSFCFRVARYSRCSVHETFLFLDGCLELVLSNETILLKLLSHHESLVVPVVAAPDPYLASEVA